MENNKNSDDPQPEELRRVNTLHEQYKTRIYNEILKRNSKSGIDKNKFEEFILKIGRTIAYYTLSTPGPTFPGPTDQRKRLEDILKAFTKPARQSPINYLIEISSGAFFIKPPYNNLFVEKNVKEMDEYLQQLNKIEKEAKAALKHIKKIFLMIQKDLSIHKKRGRGKRLNRPQLLDRAVDEVYRSCFGTLGSKALMTEIKLIVREIVGEPCTDIRKSVK